MGRKALGGWMGLAAVAIILAARGGAPASAAELLVNGGFESWAGGAPAGWVVTGSAVSAEPAGASGTGAGLATDSTLALRQVVTVQGGATYAATLMAKVESGSLAFSVHFRDGTGLTLLTRTVSAEASPAFSALSLPPSLVPVEATSAQVVISVTATGGTTAVVVDSASLEETAPPPPATPTSIATPPPTSAVTPTVPASPSATATATRATPSPRPTATPTKPATTAATRTPTPPKLPGGLPGMPSGFGGLIANGDFELLDDEVPAYWAKVGGELALETLPYRGNAAGAVDSSSTSTKWLYQVVPVTAGTWYAATGFGRVRWGAGEVWIRVSWYASGDGSGREMEQADSNVASGSGWTALATGAIHAPGGAGSARVRLMLRPEPGFASGAFDDVAFAVTAAPAATATPAPSATPTPTIAPVAPSPNGPPAATEPPAATATPPAAASDQPRAPLVPGPVATPPAFTVQPVAGPLSLRLSEVMADPSEPGRDSELEWVEVVNVGGEPVDLAGWTIGDAGATDPLPALVVPPGGFAVIAGRSAAFDPAVLVAHVADGEIGNGLNNAGDAVRLAAPDGTEVDSLSFGDNRSVFDPAPAAPQSGASLGVVAAGAVSAPENWATTLRPTPGGPNLFPAPPAATAGPSPQPQAAAAPGSQPDDAAAPAIVEDGDGASALPWTVLGGTIGVSATAVALAGWQRYQRRKAGPPGGD